MGSYITNYETYYLSLHTGTCSSHCLPSNNGIRLYYIGDYFADNLKDEIEKNCGTNATTSPIRLFVHLVACQSLYLCTVCLSMSVILSVQLLF